MIHALKKVLATPHQSGLKKTGRLGNLKRSFAIKDRSFENKKVLLVDDVFTTGTTLSTAAKLLLKNGAATVVILCCARTPLKVSSNSTKH